MRLISSLLLMYICIICFAISNISMISRSTHISGIFFIIGCFIVGFISGEAVNERR